jgi:hypothetical protein
MYSTLALPQLPSATLPARRPALRYLPSQPLRSPAARGGCAAGQRLRGRLRSLPGSGPPLPPCERSARQASPCAGERVSVPSLLDMASRYTPFLL